VHITRSKHMLDIRLRRTAIISIWVCLPLQAFEHHRPFMPRPVQEIAFCASADVVDAQVL